MAHTCVALLTPAFASRFEAKPEALAAFVATAHRSGGREWSAATRARLAAHVAALVDRLLGEPPPEDAAAAAARWAEYQARCAAFWRGRGDTDL